MSLSSSEAGRIEQDLDQTRSRLDGHLSELQSRLSPGQVLDDLMRYFRGKEGADFGRSLLDSVRANPLPTAVSGIGLAWLMASSPRGGAASAPGAAGKVRVYRGTPDLGLQSHDAPNHAAFGKRVSDAEQRTTHEPGEAEHAYADRLDAARGQAIGLARGDEETATSYSQRIREVLDMAQDTAGRGAHDLRDGARSAASGLSSGAQDAVHSLGDAGQRAGSSVMQGGQAAGQAVSQAGGNLVAAISASPVLLGALGLAAGALLGALLPQSEQEEAALGGVATQARDTARTLAQQAADKGGHVAQAVLDTGRDSAQAHGLTDGKSSGELLDAAMNGSLAKDAKQVAEDVLHAGDDAVREAAPGQDQRPSATSAPPG